MNNIIGKSVKAVTLIGFMTMMASTGNAVTVRTCPDGTVVADSQRCPTVKKRPKGEMIVAPTRNSKKINRGTRTSSYTPIGYTPISKKLKRRR